MNFQTNVKSGLAFPTTRGQGGYFAVKSGMRLAWGSLVFPLLTPIGSRPMKRQWGSGLTNMTFSPVNVNDPAIRLVVVDTAAKYCPDVTVRQVTATNSGSVVKLGLIFSLANQPVRSGLLQPVTAGYQ